MFLFPERMLSQSAKDVQTRISIKKTAFATDAEALEHIHTLFTSKSYNQVLSCIEQMPRMAHLPHMLATKIVCANWKSQSNISKGCTFF
jgi:hypothetical protein